MEFKDIFLWLIVFIVGSLIVSFIIYPQSFQSFKLNIKRITGNVIDKIEETKENLKENVADKTCPANIIPEKLILYEEKGIVDGKWKDGTEIVRYESTSDISRFIDDTVYGITCARGNEEGENINYFYCDNLLYSPAKTGVNDEGVLESTGKMDYKINLVLESIEDEKWETNHPASGYVKKFGNYSVIDSSCSKLD